MQSSNQAVLNEWNEAAPFWEKHRDLISQMWAPVTAALVEAGAISTGQTVLDVATGPGDPALSLARFLGPQGSVIGIDPVPAMIEAARREAVRSNLSTATFEVAPDSPLPFRDGTFDTAVSRFGVMFFPSPIHGLMEMLRVLKPGGKLALAVWHGIGYNPFFRIIEQFLERYTGASAPADPDAPNSFRFATRGKLLGILAEAGGVNATEHLLKFDMRVPLAPEDFWTLRCEMSDKLRTLLASLTEDQQAAVKRLSLEAASSFQTTDGFVFPTEVLILTASAA